MKQLIDEFSKRKLAYTEHEPMSRHTTFKIGGEARLMVFPHSAEEVSFVVQKCRECGVRCLTVGNGSNLLVADEGIDACVMLLGKGFDDVRLLDETTIYAEAGATLMKVCAFALEHSLTGLEFAYGIPGSCGGAAFMNAGAYGGEMKDVLYRCDHIDANGNAGCLENETLGLSYRHSAYYDNGCTVTGLYLRLENGDQAAIKAKMQDLIGRRREKQPLEYPSALFFIPLSAK